MGSLVVRASDSRPEGLGSMTDATKYPPSTHGFKAEIVEVEKSDVTIYRPFGEFCRAKIVLSPVWCSRPMTGVPLATCHDEFRGPRSDYIRQADQVHHRLVRATETPEQYQVRLQSQQVRQNASRAAETPEQRQSRLHDDQVRHRAARAAETPIQHVVHLLGLRRKRNVAITLKWRAQMYDGFMYNPRYDYESNNLLDIGRMSNVCHKCSALKWKGEPRHVLFQW
ncbi:hypothetical protein TNCV_3115451 [Trichonephila clavipes]|nr:hypothetical protein TNCV_3115451 [Trichonephila clavipes]